MEEQVNEERAAAGFAALRGLHRVLTKVSRVRDLDATLDAVVDGVVEAVGFEIAAVNVVRPDGCFEMRAVAGSQEARAALLGAVSAPEEFAEEFARADAWGALRFVPHQRLHGPARGWVSSAQEPDVADGWHPEDALFAPLRSPSGELVGMLSVDLPRDGRRPGALQRELLEMFAVHAGIAIDNARLAEQLREEHERLQVSQESLSLAFDGSDVGMAKIALGPDDAGRFLRVNPGLQRITGYTAEQLASMRVGDLSHPDDLAAERDRLLQALAEGAKTYTIESRYRRADGSVVRLSVNHSIIRNGRGEVLYGFVNVHDVTERHAAEQRLREEAARDALTGLPNRAALARDLSSAIAAAASGDHRGAVVFCDLDGFKAVNDVHGHDAGDTVLRVVAARLRTVLRAGDVVARLGGDEFVLVLRDIDEQALRGTVDRLLAELGEPIDHHGTALRVTASLGIAVLDQHAVDADTIMRRADIAMYRAKRAGRNQHAYHLDRTDRGLELAGTGT
jgi:diguanylate cyclase (GGDEF)-like protein/PAS domain S-box-containing protein